MVRRSVFAFVLFACWVAGLDCIGQDPKKAAVPATSARVSDAEQPSFRGLDASLYMQTSAEYRACCLQAYRWAKIMVQQKMKDRKPGEKPPAVVLDLDETVLDNGWFQAQQIRATFGFDQDSWAKWEAEGGSKLRLVPGAKAFIETIRTMGVEPVYITNRNNLNRKATMKALESFGLAVPEDQLHCADAVTGSSKTSRRAKVAEKFEILLFVGDNLRDFDDRFRFDPTTGIEGRMKVVDELSEQFGIEWIIIPNPAYGEWNKAFTNTLEDTRLLYK